MCQKAVGTFRGILDGLATFDQLVLSPPAPASCPAHQRGPGCEIHRHRRPRCTSYRGGANPTTVPVPCARSTGHPRKISESRAVQYILVRNKSYSGVLKTALRNVSFAEQLPWPCSAEEGDV